MLHHTAVNFQLQDVAVQLKKLLGKYSTLCNEADPFAQFAIEEQLDNIVENLFPVDMECDNDIDNFVLSPETTSNELAIYSTSKAKTVLHIGEQTFLTIDQNGYIFVTKLELENILRVKFNYRDISSISYGSNRVLISSSACASLYNSSDWSKLCDLKNTDGAVYKSVASESGSHFATIHHEKRSVQVWNGKDGKQLWRNVLNHVPCSISFSPGVGKTALEEHHRFDCLALGLWSGQIQIYNLTDGKIIGRIHTVGNSSLTDVKYTFINQKPFILAGHANGQIGWYSAKCGTMTAVTPPSQSSIENFVSIKDTIYAVSQNSVQIWANKGDCDKRALISPEEHHNTVFSIIKVQSFYFILYKYGYIGLFDENYQQMGSSKYANDIGFIGAAVVLDDTSTAKCKTCKFSCAQKTVVAMLSNLTAQVFQLHLCCNFDITIIDYKFKPAPDGFTRIAAHYAAKKLNILVANGANSKIGIYTPSKSDASTLKLRDEVKESFIGLYRADFCVGAESYGYFYVGQYFIETRKNPTSPSGNKKSFPHKIMHSCCNYETDVRVAIGYENTNIEIYNSKLELTRAVNAGQPFTYMSLQVDLLITASLDEIRVWSKKKSETIASKPCSISSAKAVIINLKEATDWADEMNMADAVSLHDISSIVFGTENGIDVWKPTERTKSFALACDAISSSTENGEQLLISKPDGIFQWNLTNNQYCHPSQVKTICAYQDYIITACSLKLIIWRNNLVEREFDLPDVHPVSLWEYNSRAEGQIVIFVYYSGGTFHFRQIRCSPGTMHKIQLVEKFSFPKDLGVLYGCTTSGELSNRLTVAIETVEFKNNEIMTQRCTKTKSMVYHIEFKLLGRKRNDGTVEFAIPVSIIKRKEKVNALGWSFK